MSALAGVRVLDLTRLLAGPFATRILADHGADVIKLERPDGGDDTRAFGPPFQNGESAYFMSVNAGKRSICLDLKHAEGRAVARKLALACDVFIENFRPGTAARLGLGAEELRAANPRLVYCSVSGFGATGPWSNKPGYDLAVQGRSGLMAITGEAAGPPTKVGTSIADLVTGLYAAQGVLLALYRRERTGRGDVVDLAMLDAVVSLLSYQAGIHFADDSVPRRQGNRHPTIVPYESFPASDGWFNLAVGNDSLWRRFCAAAGVESLAADPRFGTNPERVSHHDALFAELSALFRGRTVASWLALLEEAGVPCGPILEVDEVFDQDQLHAREMVVEIDHPTAGALRQLGVPVKLAEAPGAVRIPPPLLGADTETVLAEVLRFDDATIAALRASGALG